MRRQKTITIAACGDITVNELTMREIADLAATPDGSPVAAMVRLITAATDIKPEDVAAMTPSELSPLVDAMLEVNKDFFAQARAVGMEETADLLEGLIKKIFIVAFLLSSEPDTVQ